MAPPAERGAFEEALIALCHAYQRWHDHGDREQAGYLDARAAVIAAKDAEVARERERIACYVESMMTPYTGTVDTGAIQRNGAALAIAAAIRGQHD